MCLITEMLEPQLAEEDIIVYKTLRKQKDGLRSCHTDFLYKLHVLYSVDKMDLEEEDEEDFSVFDFRVMWEYRPGARRSIQPPIISVKTGFHSFTTKWRAKGSMEGLPFGDIIMVRCRVPKGSLYYRDTTNLMVSDKIILEEILND